MYQNNMLPYNFDPLTSGERPILLKDHFSGFEGGLSQKKGITVL